jgi:hypothetical protein
MIAVDYLHIQIAGSIQGTQRLVMAISTCIAQSYLWPLIGTIICILLIAKFAYLILNLIWNMGAYKLLLPEKTFQNLEN